MSEQIDALLEQRRAISRQLAMIDQQVIDSGVSWRHVAAQIAECDGSSVLAVLICRKQTGYTMLEAKACVESFIAQLKAN